MPNEKNSAFSAILSATNAARGISIIVPTRKLTFFFAFLITASAVSRTIGSRKSNSAFVPTRGIIISGKTFIPFFAMLQAASMIALVCMTQSSGYVTESLHPRWPSIGFISCRLLTRSFILAGVCFSLLAISFMPDSLFGKNSCKGGSNSLIVTGNPSISLNIPSKSFLW